MGAGGGGARMNFAHVTFRENLLVFSMYFIVANKIWLLSFSDILGSFMLSARFSRLCLRRMLVTSTASVTLCIAKLLQSKRK